MRNRLTAEIFVIFTAFEIVAEFYVFTAWFTGCHLTLLNFDIYLFGLKPRFEPLCISRCSPIFHAFTNIIKKHEAIK